MKQVKILLLAPSYETEVRTQAESRGFSYLGYLEGYMIFEKENGHIDRIYDLYRLEDLAPHIRIIE